MKVKCKKCGQIGNIPANREFKEHNKKFFARIKKYGVLCIDCHDFFKPQAILIRQYYIKEE